MPRGTKRASTGSIDLKKRSKRRDSSSSPSQDVANEEQTQEEKTQQLMKEEERKEFYEKMKQQAAENRGKRLSTAGLHHEAPEVPSRRGRRSTSRSNNPLRSTNTLSVAENKIPAFSSPQSEEIPSKTPAENSSPSMSSNDSQQYNSKSPSFLETDLDQLYPSIAVSDAFNAIGNMCAAFVAFTNGHEIAGLGFLSVWIAALVGVLRFGVSEKMFCKANQDLANVAGFVGFPVIGMSFVANHYKDLQLNLLMISGFMVALEAFTRSFLDKNRDNARICVNIIFFVAPIAAVCRETADFSTLIALITFVFSGIVITADHEKRIFGVRCVDWFHYSLGVTSYFIACGLGKV